MGQRHGHTSEQATRALRHWQPHAAGRETGLNGLSNGLHLLRRRRVLPDADLIAVGAQQQVHGLRQARGAGAEHLQQTPLGSSLRWGRGTWVFYLLSAFRRSMFLAG